MTADEVDAFFRDGVRTLPAAPSWRDGNRGGEKRASLPIASDGAISRVTLEVTIRLAEPEYLMMLLLCQKAVICRLCMTTGHWDRRSKTLTNQAHFHSWQANRGSRTTIPTNLNRLEIVPDDVSGRDSAFVWFLARNGLTSPPWSGAIWPIGQGML